MYAMERVAVAVAVVVVVVVLDTTGTIVLSLLHIILCVNHKKYDFRRQRRTQSCRRHRHTVYIA